MLDSVTDHHDLSKSYPSHASNTCPRHQISLKKELFSIYQLSSELSQATGTEFFELLGSLYDSNCLIVSAFSQYLWFCLAFFFQSYVYSENIVECYIIAIPFVSLKWYHSHFCVRNWHWVSFSLVFLNILYPVFSIWVGN